MILGVGDAVIKLKSSVSKSVGPPMLYERVKDVKIDGSTVSVVVAQSANTSISTSRRA